ncbi:dCTP pyrophosphatase 1 [Perkinsus olseni]|uniref:dCTP pyrophosphatase 1 n=2 Tax=Perkinsus olseni TaxID=32597 RepID=A0A7J6UHD2_PEROL|nr:dCTP pyrophosphatase 1 [Perkinsus olseni]
MVEMSAQSSSLEVPDKATAPIRDIQRKLSKGTTPAACGLRVARAAGLVAEALQWKGEGAVPLKDGESEKLSDRLHALIRLILVTANCLSIDVAEAAGLKVAKNKAKYPAEIVRGSSAKYNEYDSYTPRKCRVGGARDVETLEQMAEEMTQFAIDRDWLQYHTPRNLTLALCGEVGELCELLAEQDGAKECSNASPEAEEISDYGDNKRDKAVLRLCSIDLSVVYTPQDPKFCERLSCGVLRPLLPHLYDGPNENVEKVTGAGRSKLRIFESVSRSRFGEDVHFSAVCLFSSFRSILAALKGSGFRCRIAYVFTCCLGRRLFLPMACSLFLCVLLYPLLYALKLPYDQSVRALGLNDAVYVDSTTEPVGCSPEVR